MYAVQVMVLTCDLPNSAEYIEFFWVQSFNVVIDVSVNDNRRLKYTIKGRKIIATVFYTAQISNTPPNHSNEKLAGQQIFFYIL